MSVQSFFGFLGEVILLIGFFVAGPFLLFFLATSYAERLEARGKYHKAYRFSRTVYYFTDIPLLRLWIGKYHYLQLRQLSLYAEKIGNHAAAMDWLRLASDPRFLSSERINALTALATLLRKQSRSEEAEAVEAEALAVVSSPTRAEKAPGKSDYESSSAEGLRAGVLIRTGRFTEALALLEQVATSAKKPSWVVEEGQVTALRYLGRYDDAITVHESRGQNYYEKMERMLTASPENGKAATTLRPMLNQVRTTNKLTTISLHLEAGQVENASEQWKQLPEAMDDLTRATRHAVGAWLSATRGDGDAVNEQIAKAEAAPMPDDDTRQKVAFTLARAEFTLQKYADAAERLAKLVQATAYLPLAQAEYRALLAATYAKMERTADARAEYEQVIAAGFAEAQFTQIAQSELSKLATNTSDTSAD